jgi:CRP-like cAMP-binding protein
MSAFIRKMEHGAPLNDADKAVLQDAVGRTKHVDARHDLIQEGDEPDDVQLILEGFACRYKLLPNGERSIMALLVPGDFCDLHVAILGEMDHNIGTLSPCTVAEISRETVEYLTESNPRIARALWWASLVDEGVLREWLVSLGRRQVDPRLAHLICELLVRLKAVGLADANSYDLPLTQGELADVMGCSLVHVNRSVQALRSAGLIKWQGKRRTILSVPRLIDLADFTPNYLHLDKKLGTGSEMPIASALAN